MKNFHYRQAYLYFIYKVISIEAPKSNFQGIPLLPGLPVDKKRVRIWVHSWSPIHTPSNQANMQYNKL